ncbi:MAG: hypothetical protein ABI622_06745 [Chloroflexota bacterium]
MTYESWPTYVWAATVLLAIAAGAWTATNRPGVRPGVPLQHVAGATLLAYFAWEMLVNLPGPVVSYWVAVDGLGDTRALAGQQAYLAGQAAFVVAGALSVVGILRGRTWAAVMGIGLAVAVVVARLAIFASTLATFGDALGADDSLYLSMVNGTILLGAVPAFVAAGLLARPLLQRASPRSGASTAEPATRPG